MSDIRFVEPDPYKMIVLEKVIEGVEPDYLAYGKTRCVECDHWCWLGKQTFKVVINGGAMPFCEGCGVAYVRPDNLIGQYVDE